MAEKPPTKPPILLLKDHNLFIDNLLGHKTWRIGHLFQRNSDGTQVLLVCTDEHDQLCQIITYGIDTDTYDAFDYLQLQALNISHFACALEDFSNLVMHDNGKTILIDIQNKQIKTLVHPSLDLEETSIVCINGEVHIFGEKLSEGESILGAHIKININDGKVEFESDIEGIKLKCQQTLYLKQSKAILIIPDRSREIFKYSLEARAYESCKVIMKKVLARPQGTLSCDGRFLICFGRGGGEMQLNVVDLEKGECIERFLNEYGNVGFNYVKRLVCLTKRSNRKRDRILCHGFVKDSIMEFEGRQWPFYLRELVATFVYFETIEFINDDFLQLSINIDDILSH